MTAHARSRWTAFAAVLVLLGLLQLPASAAVTSVYVGSFYFSTSSGGPSNTPVSVDNGDQVRFVAQDNGHTVEIPGLGISQALTKGQTFTTGALMKAGTYALYCSPHRNRGHETTLTVRASAAQEPSPESPAPAPSPEPRPSPPSKASPAPARTAGATESSAPVAPDATAAGGTATATAKADAPAPAASPSASATRSSGSPAAPASTGASPSAGPLVEGGLGTATEDEVAVPAAEGSLEDLLGRPAAKDGNWTRSVWMATGLLLPMLALAALALARRERDSTELGES